MKINKYHLMTFTAFILALFSSVMTALGMSDLFEKGGIIIFLVFMCIDLGRFLLFNFLTDEWKNLRGIKYIIAVILALLFGYSAVGIFSQLNNMISPITRQAMLNAASYNKAASNALIKQSRTEDLSTLARKEYDDAMAWNKTDYENCLKRAKAGKPEDLDKAENKCNNTKRTLDNKASKQLKESLAKADANLDKVEQTTKDVSHNQSELAAVLTSICEIGRMDCGSYQGLQNALSIIILLVIVGTDYLQIAIVLAVNTRKNKKDPGDDPSDNTPKGKKKVLKEKEDETKVEDTTNAKLSKKASKKLAKKINKKTKSKTNKTLKEAMESYNNLLSSDFIYNETTKPSVTMSYNIDMQPTKADVIEFKEEKKEEKIEEVEPKKTPKKRKTTSKKKEKTIEIEVPSEEIGIVTEDMSAAQKEAVTKLKKELDDKKASKLDSAFAAAKNDIEKGSKNKNHIPSRFTSETGFM